MRLLQARDLKADVCQWCQTSSTNPKCCGNLCNRMMGSGSFHLWPGDAMLPSISFGRTNTEFVFCTAEAHWCWNDSPEWQCQVKQGVSLSYLKAHIGIKVLKHPFSLTYLHLSQIWKRFEPEKVEIGSLSCTHLAQGKSRGVRLLSGCASVYISAYGCPCKTGGWAAESSCCFRMLDCIYHGRWDIKELWEAVSPW